MRCKCCGPREASSKPDSGSPAYTNCCCLSSALLDHLPSQLRDALEVALTLRSGPAPERFAVGVAALSLLSRCAEDRPLLLLIDDAHLLDPATAETLRFVARRLVADPIALLAFCGPNPTRFSTATGLPTLELTGLGIDAATTLIATRQGRRQAPTVRRHCIVRLPAIRLRYWSCRRISTASPACRPNCPVAVPDAIARAFSGRVSTLTESAQRALLIAAIADGDLATTAQAAARLGCAIDDLVEAEAIGLLRLVGDRAEFRHPLVRPAIYSTATPGLRRDVHRAVAAVLPESSADLRAWHLSQACVGPDDDVADALAAVAESASARGALGAAVTALTRAAELTTQHGLRATRMLGAGESAWLAGQPRRADALLEKAAALATDRATLAEIDDLRGNLALLTGSLDEGREMLLRAAELSEIVRSRRDRDATGRCDLRMLLRVQYRRRACRRRPRGTTDRRLQDRRRAHPRSDGDRGSTRARRRGWRAMDPHRCRRVDDPSRSPGGPATAALVGDRHVVPAGGGIGPRPHESSRPR